MREREREMNTHRHRWAHGHEYIYIYKFLHNLEMVLLISFPPRHCVNSQTAKTSVFIEVITLADVTLVICLVLSLLSPHKQYRCL